MRRRREITAIAACEREKTLPRRDSHRAVILAIPPIIPASLPLPVIPAKAGIQNVAGAAATVRDREVVAPPSLRKAATVR